jgi:hypothetical protein
VGSETPRGIATEVDDIGVASWDSSGLGDAAAPLRARGPHNEWGRYYVIERKTGYSVNAHTGRKKGVAPVRVARANPAVAVSPCLATLLPGSSVAPWGIKARGGVTRKLKTTVAANFAQAAAAVWMYHEKCASLSLRHGAGGLAFPTVEPLLVYTSARDEKGAIVRAYNETSEVSKRADGLRLARPPAASRVELADNTQTVWVTARSAAWPLGADLAARGGIVRGWVGLKKSKKLKKKIKKKASAKVKAKK